jgi:MFS family permease
MGVAGFAMMRVLRGTRHAANAAADNLADTLAGFRNTLQAPGVAALILFQTAVTGAAFTLLAGWGVAWLRSAQGLSQAQAATALSGCALAYALGAPAWGAVPRRLGHARAWTLAGGAALAAVLGAAALGTLAAGPVLWAWLAAFGFAAASFPLVLDQVRSRLPAVLIVRGVTLLGVISIGGAGLIIALSGALIDRSGHDPRGHPPAAFEHMFTLLAGLVGAATLLLGLAARTAPDPARR